MSDDHEPLRVLIVEDNPADAFLLSMILRDLGLRLTIAVARDGQAALDMLAGAGENAATPVPDMVILDLNLPRVHGYEVLSFIRSGPLRSVPVAVMTGSLNKEDEARSLRMGATYYLTKPSTLADIDATSAFFRTELDREARKASKRGSDGAAPAGPKAGADGGMRCATGGEPSLDPWDRDGPGTGTAIYPPGPWR